MVEALLAAAVTVHVLVEPTLPFERLVEVALCQRA